MANKLIHMRVPNKLYKKIEHYVKKEGYRNAQEFSLEAIRNAIQEKRKEEALTELKKQFGSLKNTKKLTKEEREKIAEDFILQSAEKSRELLRKYSFYEGP